MKKIYFLIAFATITCANAQSIVFPNANFKTKLLAARATNYIAKDLNGNFFDIDTNNDNEIQVAEAQNVSYLNVSYSNIGSIEGIEHFTNLTYLDFTQNQVTSFNINALVQLKLLGCGNNPIGGNLNINALTALETLGCNSNGLTSLDLTGLSNLKYVNCGNNSQLTSLNVSGLNHLEELRCGFTGLVTLNVIGLPALNFLYCGDNHSLTTLNLSGTTNLTVLQVSFSELLALDLTDNINLKEVRCDDNHLTTLNVSHLSQLENLRCSENQLTSLDISNLVNLKSFDCSNNQLTTLDASVANFEYFKCSNNLLTTLNVSNSSSLNQFWCNNNQLVSLFMKCGSEGLSPQFMGNPNLEYVCVDEQYVEWITQYVQEYVTPTCEVNSYCSFTPGGAHYTIAGSQKSDFNGNGCDASDLSIPNLMITQFDGTSQLVGSYIADASGNYSIAVPAGSYTFVPKFENSDYFTISPASVNVVFPDTASPLNQSFCITPNGTHPDLEINLLPIDAARPGFDCHYKISCKNKGTVVQSGSIQLNYEDSVLDFVSATPSPLTQSANLLVFDFDALQPFESQEFLVTFNANSPMETPALNDGNVLSYTASILSTPNDETPADNTFMLHQTVVNSFDPNDKTCLEGATITPEMVGKYVHYKIRFENTGSANAENIVVKDMIDLAQFDINSLVPLDGSHSFTTKISDGNKVEFIFENIQLPFDDANNDGYVSFKIKTKSTLSVGDAFSNTASIYFDYNHPIVTDPAVTTITALATSDFVFENYFKIYPNPTANVLHIDSKHKLEITSINIYNALGQLVLVIPNAKETKSVNVSGLKAGHYFISVQSDKGKSNAKFIKQ